MFSFDFLFLFLFWFICLIVGFKYEKFFLGLSSLLGIMIGLISMIISISGFEYPTNILIGMFFLIANFYLMYHVLFKMIHTGGKQKR